ncbi:MAG: hypothetical protein HETSPECPRED_003710 [Heterodermia speciosa]|uniref:Fe2OG dioxygenase domain-containing protein n=1 Tax=Heterodermia speciosa TaxID=116794 RepID=A0A8H3F5A0_9LECA|nr:MAG: hypothetical protein HETSPECPRED_003710 [Heterodermia speciosa]
MGSLQNPSIPIVNLSAFTRDSTSYERKQAAAKLSQCCRLNGFVGITGHGMPTDLLDKVFAMSKRLFDLPLEEKLKAPHPEGWTPHRGYSGIGRENGGAKGALDAGDQAKMDPDDVSGLNMMTMKQESYEVGSEYNKEDYNIWLPEEVLPGFRDLSLEIYWRVNEIAVAVLDALIMSLELNVEEADYVRKIHTGHANQLRLLHYPPMPRDAFKAEEHSRLGAHTDGRYDYHPSITEMPSYSLSEPLLTTVRLNSTFTFDFQDANQGLEFLDRQTGKFVEARPKNGVMYMNIGDMLMRLSNGCYPAGTHRVIIPVASRTPRYSIPYFVSVDPDAVVAPQASCVGPGDRPRYEPITFRDFRDELFKATQVRDNDQVS